MALPVNNEESYFLRWRGKQTGPYPGSVIDAKLATNEIGMLHEILSNGRWMTLRDYLAEKTIALENERLEREADERRAHELEERLAREREEQKRAALQAEENKKNEVNKNTDLKTSATITVPLQPHRGGTILAFAIIGLFVCFPFCMAAWSMGSTDLHQMDVGKMDVCGRSLTSSGRTVGVAGTLLWCLGIIIYFIANV